MRVRAGTCRFRIAALVLLDKFKILLREQATAMARAPTFFFAILVLSTLFIAVLGFKSSTEAAAVLLMSPNISPALMHD